MRAFAFTLPAIANARCALTGTKREVAVVQLSRVRV